MQAILDAVDCNWLRMQGTLRNESGDCVTYYSLVDVGNALSLQRAGALSDPTTLYCLLRLMTNADLGGNDGAIAQDFIERYLTVSEPASRGFFTVPLRSAQRRVRFSKYAPTSTPRHFNFARASWGDISSVSGELLRGGHHPLDF